MEIVGVEKIKNGQVKIYFDSGQEIQMSEKNFKRLDLQKKITLDQYNFIIENVLYNEACGKALKFLSASSKSIAQIKEKLAAYPELVIENVIKFLKEYHYADDELFAKNYIYDALTLKFYGRTKIIFELRQKKIDDEIIFDALEKYLDDEKEIESATQIAKIKFKSSSPNDLLKLKNMLYRRGFSFNIIERAIKNL